MMLDGPTAVSAATRVRGLPTRCRCRWRQTERFVRLQNSKMLKPHRTRSVTATTCSGWVAVAVGRRRSGRGSCASGIAGSGVSSPGQQQVLHAPLVGVATHCSLFCALRCQTVAIPCPGAHGRHRRRHRRAEMTTALPLRLLSRLRLLKRSAPHRQAVRLQRKSRRGGRTARKEANRCSSKLGTKSWAGLVHSVVVGAPMVQPAAAPEPCSTARLLRRPAPMARRTGGTFDGGIGREPSRVA
jgi:hypothetical protein